MTGIAGKSCWILLLVLGCACAILTAGNGREGDCPNAIIEPILEATQEFPYDHNPEERQQFTPNGKFGVLYRDGGYQVWSLGPTPKLIQAFPSGALWDNVTEVVVSPSGRRIGVGFRDGHFEILENKPNGKILASAPMFSGKLPRGIKRKSREIEIDRIVFTPEENGLLVFNYTYSMYFRYFPLTPNGQIASAPVYEPVKLPDVVTAIQFLSEKTFFMEIDGGDNEADHSIYRGHIVDGALSPLVSLHSASKDNVMAGTFDVLTQSGGMSLVPKAGILLLGTHHQVQGSYALTTNTLRVFYVRNGELSAGRIAYATNPVANWRDYHSDLGSAQRAVAELRPTLSSAIHIPGTTRIALSRADGELPQDDGDLPPLSRVWIWDYESGAQEDVRIMYQSPGMDRQERSRAFYASYPLLGVVRNGRYLLLSDFNGAIHFFDLRNHTDCCVIPSPSNMTPVVQFTYDQSADSVLITYKNGAVVRLRLESLPL